MATARANAVYGARINQLPVLPTVVFKLRDLLFDEKSDADTVAAEISKDPSLTATLLKWVNSAYYAVPYPVSSPARAVKFLGYQAVQQLVMSVCAMQTLNQTSSSLYVPPIWTHSLQTAILCEQLSRHMNFLVPSDLFTMGLLHDIGKLALAAIEPETFDGICRRAEAEGVPYHVAESRLKAPTHTHLGARLAHHWKLPEQVCVAVAMHHLLELEYRRGIVDLYQSSVDMVLIANEMAIHCLEGGRAPKILAHEKIARAAIERLGLNAADLERVAKKGRHAIQQNQDFFALIQSI